MTKPKNVTPQTGEKMQEAENAWSPSEWHSQPEARQIRLALEGISKVREAEDAYALAVGRVSGAWNSLHRTLGELFAVIIGGDRQLLLTAWRSIENDRAQREMLRATIKAASPERWKRTPKAPDDLLWVLKRAGKLADVRNDAIHALVSLHIWSMEVNVALPPRGKREEKLFANAVKGRKLIDEFAKCQQDADALSVFVQLATGALAGRQKWPTPQPKQMW
jgi:hypothetical protein